MTIPQEALKSFIFRPSQYKPHSINQNETIEYYIQAYEKYKNGQAIWNWAAFFWNDIWAIYRGMYFLGYLVPFLVWIIFLLRGSPVNFSFVFLVLYFFLNGLFWGFFGNKLYFKFIERRYKKGYTEEGTHPLLTLIFHFPPLISLPPLIVFSIIENRKKPKN